ncbi:MAG TPA: ABC transporter substrate-binding protein [Candidatus Baltobacteraceae bacterium]|nr:ABC transporter substrate-binding protein [Candidatus Baltobacteraceae bacterium]
MRRTTVSSGILVVAFFLLCVPSSWAGEATSGEILIGMSAPLTGGWAAEADLYVKAIKLAEKQINEAGGVNGKKIRMIITDNQSTNPGALAALNRNVEQDKVLAMIGPVKSTQILAMSDAVKAYGIPMMVGGTNASITKVGNPWFFRCRVSDAIMAAAAVKYIKEDLKLTKIGLIYSNEAFGTGGADLVEHDAKALGLSIVARESFTLGDRDFTSQLLSLKRAGAEVFVPYSAGTVEVAKMHTQYRQLGSPYKYVGIAGFAMKHVLNLSREASEGLGGIVEVLPNQSEQNRKYIEDFKREFNTEPDMLATWNYDALHLLANAIRKVGEDRAKLRDAILATKGYPGVIGTFNFSPDGEGLRAAFAAVIQNGEAKLIKPVNVE